ncbi:MAG: hypothetical protein WC538_02970 [Thermoanaerobaculia bacterium]|jgi:hypothetical protein
MKPSRVVTLAIATLMLATPLAAKPAKKKDAPKTLCSFAHYPVEVGNSSEYRLSSKQKDASGKVLQENSSTYSEEIVAVEADRYKTKTVSEGNVAESEWTCSADGVALKYGDFPDTKITASGVTIPSTMEIGGSWTQSFTMEAPGVNQTTKTTNRVTKREEITVPEGTFEAWRVDYDVETTIPGQEGSVIHGSQWFVTDVGVVKSMSVVSMEMDQIRSIETTIELVKHTKK